MNENLINNQNPKAFAPNKGQKGLSEGIWTNYLPKLQNGVAKGIIVDLGCGFNKLISPKDSYKVLGVDHNRNKLIDINCDLNERLPFDDNSIDGVFSEHCIEHLKDRDHVFSEIHRILRPGGIAFIKVPHFRDIQAENYDHLTRWASFSMNTFANAKWYSADFPHFEIIRIGIKWRLGAGWLKRWVDRLINKSFTLSETWLWYPLGGFHECQYLMRKQ